MPSTLTGKLRFGSGWKSVHPATWTSYAELCSAMGLTRSLAPTVARQVTFDATGAHWYRVRDESAGPS